MSAAQYPRSRERSQAALLGEVAPASLVNSRLVWGAREFSTVPSRPKLWPTLTRILKDVGHQWAAG